MTPGVVCLPRCLTSGGIGVVDMDLLQTDAARRYRPTIRDTSYDGAVNIYLIH